MGRMALLGFCGVVLVSVNLALGAEQRTTWSVPFQGDEKPLVEIRTNPQDYLNKTFIICGDVRTGNRYISTFHNASDTHYALLFWEWGEKRRGDLSASLYVPKNVGAGIAKVVVDFETRHRDTTARIYKLARFKVVLLRETYRANRQWDVYLAIDAQFLNADKSGWQPWIVGEGETKPEPAAKPEATEPEGAPKEPSPEPPEGEPPPTGLVDKDGNKLNDVAVSTVADKTGNVTHVVTVPYSAPGKTASKQRRRRSLEGLSEESKRDVRGWHAIKDKAYLAAAPPNKPPLPVPAPKMDWSKARIANISSNNVIEVADVQPGGMHYVAGVNSAALQMKIDDRWVIRDLVAVRMARSSSGPVYTYYPREKQLAFADYLALMSVKRDREKPKPKPAPPRTAPRPDVE